MEKKNWIIASLCFILVFVCIGLFFFFQNNEKEKQQVLLDSIQLEFNNIRTVEYGSQFDTKSLIKNIEEDVSFEEVDTKQIGKQTVIFKVTKEGVSKDFEYTIEVVDTKAPVIVFTKDKVIIEFGKDFNMKNYIKNVSDVIDGKLLYREAKEVNDGDTGYYTYVGEVNTNKTGTYKIKVIAVDINNNKTEKQLIIAVSSKNNNSVNNNETNTSYVPNNNNKVIVVNAGHQGKGNSKKEPIGPGSSNQKAKVSSGTTGVSSKIPESQITLNVALKLRAELQARGYTVVMTRTSQDINISNQERAEIGNKNNAAAVISLHCDGATDRNVRGAHTIAINSNNPYTPKTASASQSLAKEVINSYCSATGIKNRGVSLRNDLTGLNWSKVPAIYIEMGFISNSAEDKLLTNSLFQNKCAKGIAKGKDNYFH